MPNTWMIAIGSSYPLSEKRVPISYEDYIRYVEDSENLSWGEELSPTRLEYVNEYPQYAKVGAYFGWERTKLGYDITFVFDKDFGRIGISLRNKKHIPSIEEIYKMAKHLGADVFTPFAKLNIESYLQKLKGKAI